MAGADEAGRGSLAGPLVAAAVLFDLDELTLGRRRGLSALNDSKQQTPQVRETLYPRILSAAAKVAIIASCARGIDSRGLHVTNLQALRTALRRVSCGGAVCLVDGFKLGGCDLDVRSVVDGDCKSAAVAAASVVAKVTRDRYMRQAEAAHPGFSFATNVGYSTPEHRAAIQALGLTPLHRLSFASVAYTQLELED